MEEHVTGFDIEKADYCCTKCGFSGKKQEVINHNCSMDTIIQKKDKEIAILKDKVKKLERSIYARENIEEINDILNYEANNYGNLEEGVINLLKRYKTVLEEILEEV